MQAAFVYDADGNRVQATVGSVRTLYPGKHYEYVNSTSVVVSSSNAVLWKV